MRPFQLEKASSIDNAILLKKSDAQFIAGGTNLVDLMKKHITQPEVLIDVTEALSQHIKLENNTLHIDAMASNTNIAINKIVLEKFPLLSKAILAGASPQIRNMASAAGNILQRTRCPYFYDLSTPCNKRVADSGCGAYNGANRMSAVIGYNDKCVAVHPSDFCIGLVALDANVCIITKEKKLTKIPFKDFHKLPEDTPWQDNNLPSGAIISHLEISINNFNKNYSYVKLRDRTSYAFALVSVGAALELNGNIIKSARLASGGMAHKPWRWYEVEQYLVGKNATIETFEKAAKLASKDLKPLSENAFKIPMLEGAIVTALQNCIA